MRFFEPEAVAVFAKQIDQVARAYADMLQADLNYKKEQANPQWAREAAGIMELNENETERYIIHQLEARRQYAEAMRSRFTIEAGALAAAWTIRFGLPNGFSSTEI